LWSGITVALGNWKHRLGHQKKKKYTSLPSGESSPTRQTKPLLIAGEKDGEGRIDKKELGRFDQPLASIGAEGWNPLDDVRDFQKFKEFKMSP